MSEVCECTWGWKCILCRPGGILRKQTGAGEEPVWGEVMCGVRQTCQRSTVNNELGGEVHKREMRSAVLSVFLEGKCAFLCQMPCSAALYTADSGNSDDAKHLGQVFIPCVCQEVALFVLCLCTLHLSLRLFSFSPNSTRWCIIALDRISISFPACFCVWAGNSSWVHLFEVSVEHILEGLQTF